MCNHGRSAAVSSQISSERESELDAGEFGKSRKHSFDSITIP